MTRRRWIGLAGYLTIVIVVAIVAIAGGGSNQPGASAKQTASATATAPPTTAAPGPSSTAVASTTAPASTTVPTGAPAARLPPGIDAARAAARLFLIGFGGTRARAALLDRFRSHEWGGVVLEPGNGESPQQVADLVGEIRRAAVDGGHEPPLVAASQLGGGDLDAVPVGAPLQSQLRDAATARATALAVAKALHPLGIRMVLGPDADVGFAGGPWEGIAYSDDPAAVATMAAAAVAGYKDGEVAAVPGHFPGEGAASGDPAVEAATVGVSLADLRARDFKPFAALAVHAPAIQLSSATYVAFDGVTPATLLPETVELLRGELGFGGVIVSGDLAAASLAGGEPVAKLAVDALKAGADLLWIPGAADDQLAAWRAVTRAVKDGDVPRSRVAEALARVSALREKYGVR